jgi:hypothetical protein
MLMLITFAVIIAPLGAGILMHHNAVGLGGTAQDCARSKYKQLMNGLKKWRGRKLNVTSLLSSRLMRLNARVRALRLLRLY